MICYYNMFSVYLREKDDVELTEKQILDKTFIRHEYMPIKPTIKSCTWFIRSSPLSSFTQIYEEK